MPPLVPVPACGVLGKTARKDYSTVALLND